MSAPVVRNAFDMMKAAQAKPAPPASHASDEPPSSGPGPHTTAAIFKGSGLGAGPRHVVSAEDQPWVEK